MVRGAARPFGVDGAYALPPSPTRHCGGPALIGLNCRASATPTTSASRAANADVVGVIGGGAGAARSARACQRPAAVAALQARQIGFSPGVERPPPRPSRHPPGCGGRRGARKALWRAAAAAGICIYLAWFCHHAPPHGARSPSRPRRVRDALVLQEHLRWRLTLTTLARGEKGVYKQGLQGC
jgi:hypothetical protein